MSSETAASSASPKGADGEGESEQSQVPRPNSSGGVDEASEPSAVPGEVSKAPPVEAASGKAAAEKAPLPEDALRRKMRPCLDGLTDSLTLQIFSELDFCSLAAVRGVSRRLGRIAKDPSLFRRVSRVQWTSGEEKDDEPPFGSHGTAQDGVSRFQTDCRQLGPIQMPEDEKEAARKFLEILEGLLEGGASPVSLQFPRFHHGGVTELLSALLSKRKVRLEALAGGHGCQPRGLRELLRSQPGLTHLCLDYNPLKEPLIVQEIPSLRHIKIHYDLMISSSLEKLAPQLRSLVVHRDSWNTWDSWIFKKVPKPKGSLLFQAVGKLTVGGQPWRKIADNIAFAVEDFGWEERGKPFLLNGEPWDAWGEAEHRIPQPTGDWDQARRFLHDELQRQEKERAQH